MQNSIKIEEVQLTNISKLSLAVVQFSIFAFGYPLLICFLILDKLSGFIPKNEAMY